MNYLLQAQRIVFKNNLSGINKMNDLDNNFWNKDKYANTATSETCKLMIKNLREKIKGNYWKDIRMLILN